MKVLGTLALCGLSVLAAPAKAQRVDSTVAIGTSTRVWSKTLGEERRLLIYLPPHYAASEKSYPVLYLLDAEEQFFNSTGIVQFLGSYNDRIPEMIVVGITNTDRGRDLTPPILDAEAKKKAPPTYGHADAFLRFMADELVPWVEARYRTVPYRILVGHSFGGLFSAYTFVNRPEVFQAHIAISPSLWFDNEGALRRTEAGIRKLQHPPWLFVSWGDNEKLISETARPLVEHLTAQPVPGLTLEHRYYPGDDHMSTPHKSLYDALSLLYADWRMPLSKDSEPVDVTLDQVEAHYAALSARFGYAVPPSPAALEAVARTLLKQKENEQALAVLRRNVRYYPYLAGTHEQLAEALEKLDRKEEALRSYEDAVAAAVNDDGAYSNPIAEYRKKVKELGGKK